MAAETAKGTTVTTYVGAGFSRLGSAPGDTPYLGSARRLGTPANLQCAPMSP